MVVDVAEGMHRSVQDRRGLGIELGARVVGDGDDVIPQKGATRALASVNLTIRVWMSAAMDRNRANSPSDGLSDKIPSASRNGSNREANSPTGNSRIHTPLSQSSLSRLKIDPAGLTFDHSKRAANSSKVKTSRSVPSASTIGG